MSHEYAWPSSSDLEIEARRLHAGPRQGHVDDLGFALALRRFPPGFEFAISLIAAIAVFPVLLFSALPQALALVAGLAIWLVAPIVAALPIPLFDLVQRRHGRGVRLTAARVISGAATAAIAFLPGVKETGAVAVLFLVACRLSQGLALRGLSVREGGLGAGSFRPRFGLSDLAGAVIGAAILGVLALILTPADFLQWGWRYPFMVAIACNIVGLFADLRVLATPQRQAPERARLRLVS